MKKGQIIGKILCVTLVCLMIGTAFGGLAGAISPFDNPPKAVQASTLAGDKGMWIWKIWDLGESVSQIIDKLESAGVEWVTVKCGDSDSYYLSPGMLMYNWLITNGYGDFGEVVTQFHDVGIKVFGWHYVYSYDRWGVSGVTEADVSNQILDIPGIDGLIIDAEAEYEGGGKGPIAEAYMRDIRNSHPSDFVAYTTFPIIDYHLWFPYIEFGRYCDAVMPQAYWKDIGVTPAEMVNWMNEQWDKWHETWKSAGYGDSVKPLIPVGQGDVSGSEITEFCELVLSRYEGVSLWRYGTMTSGAWTAYAAVGGEPAPVVTSSLRIVQSPPYYVGDTVTAEFTITNKGTAAITFDVLTAGGRDPDDQVADFTWRRDITLDPNESYNYQGTLTLAKAGTYHFFCAYRTPDGNWNTAIPTESGVTNVLDITVSLPPNTPPELSDGYVEPASGDTSTDFYYYVAYFDPDGDEPSVKQVYIDGIAYTMRWHSSLDSWITYRYGPKNLPAGSHTYYFYFEDGRGGTARLPTSGSYFGPTVNNPPNPPSNPSPSNHATNVSIDADLSWSGGDPDAGDTVTYDVYFGISTPPPLVSNDQSATTYDPGTLSYSTIYYWKIIATDNHGASTEGPIWDFATQYILKPDLIIEDISWSPTEPYEGDIVTYTVYIRNQGDADAGSFIVTYGVNDLKLGEWSIGGLSAGTTVPKQFSRVCQDKHTVWAQADTYNSVSEIDETNNYREKTVDIWIRYPYLTAEQVELEVMTDGEVLVNVTISPPHVNFRVEWGSAIRSHNVFEADAKVWEWTGPIPWIIPIPLSHTYSLGVLLDGEYQFIFKVWSIPVEEVSFIIDTTPPTVIDHTPTGTDVPVITTINVTFSEPMNKSSVQSAFSISPPVSGSFSWSGNKMIFTPYSDLVYNTTYNVIIGTGAMDLACNHLESPYSWNFATVIALPDLIVSEISFSNYNPLVGETVEMNVSVKNIGAETVTYLTLKVWDNGTYFDGVEGPINIAPGKGVLALSHNVCFATPGIHNVTAMVDWDNRIAESDETNNAVTAFINVTAPVQMIILVQDQPYASYVLVNITVWSNQDYTNASVQADFLWNDTLIGQVSNFTDIYTGSNTFNLTWDSLEAPINVIGENITARVTIENSLGETLFFGETTFILTQPTKELLWDRLTELVLAWPNTPPAEKNELWGKIVKIVMLYPNAPASLSSID